MDRLEEIGTVTVPCERCQAPTTMLGTKRCNRCWELETRIQHSPGFAQKILSEVLARPECAGPRRVARTSIKKREGEYRVMAWDQFGKRYPEADYFTDDKEDAEDTAKAMKEFQIQPSHPTIIERGREAVQKWKEALSSQLSMDMEAKVNDGKEKDREAADETTVNAHDYMLSIADELPNNYHTIEGADPLLAMLVRINHLGWAASISDRSDDALYEEMGRLDNQLEALF